MYFPTFFFLSRGKKHLQSFKPVSPTLTHTENKQALLCFLPVYTWTKAATLGGVSSLLSPAAGRTLGPTVRAPCFISEACTERLPNPALTPDLGGGQQLRVDTGDIAFGEGQP